MKSTLVFVFTFLAIGFSMAQEPNYSPESGYIPDSKTAVAVAEAVLAPIYGQERVLNQRPFSVNEGADQWTVSGSRRRGELGGVATIVISKKTGAILRVSHSR